MIASGFDFHWLQGGSSAGQCEEALPPACAVGGFPTALTSKMEMEPFMSTAARELESGMKPTELTQPPLPFWCTTRQSY